MIIFTIPPNKPIKKQCISDTLRNEYIICQNEEQKQLPIIPSTRIVVKNMDDIPLVHNQLVNKINKK